MADRETGRFSSGQLLEPETPLWSLKYVSYICDLWLLGAGTAAKRSSVYNFTCAGPLRQHAPNVLLFLWNVSARTCVHAINAEHRVCTPRRAHLSEPRICAGRRLV